MYIWNVLLYKIGIDLLMGKSMKNIKVLSCEIMLSLAQLHLSLTFFLLFFQLVYEAILSSAREIVTLEDEDGNESIDIALVHVAHSRVQHRLRCFDTLVKANPDLVPRLRGSLQGKEPEVVSLNALLWPFFIR